MDINIKFISSRDDIDPDDFLEEIRAIARKSADYQNDNILVDWDFDGKLGIEVYADDIKMTQHSKDAVVSMAETIYNRLVL